MDHPVVLITGALTGVGRATALAFAREGARLVISGRRDDAGQAFVGELRALGAEAEYVHADVRHESDVSRLVDQVVERFGRLDPIRETDRCHRAAMGRRFLPKHQLPAQQERDLEREGRRSDPPR